MGYSKDREKDQDNFNSVLGNLENIQFIQEVPEEIIIDNEISNEPIETSKKKKKRKLEEESLKDESSEVKSCNHVEKENIEEIKSTSKKRKKKELDTNEIVDLEEFSNEEDPKGAKCHSVIAEDTINENSFEKFMKPKQVMKSLFIKNPTLLFNGSNINEIQGYGAYQPPNY